ncbi:MAG: GNA1162 family protein [Elusimicrobiales bacterium]
MRKTFFAISAAALLSGCNHAQVILNKGSEAAKPMRVAVLPFSPEPSHPRSGELAYESFSTYLMGVSSYRVLDRGALEQVLKEQNLNNSGIFDQREAVQIGKLLGAEGVIVGSVHEYVHRKGLMFPPAKVTITARLINTRTGEVEWSASSTRGGATRWLTWLIWPVGVYATVTSPSVEDQVRAASSAIAKALDKKITEAGSF